MKTIEEVKQLISLGHWSIEIHTHSENLEFLKENISAQPNDGISFSAKPIPIYANDVLSKEVKTWVFPPTKNKFYSYTSEDEVWAKPIRFGYERSDRAFYVFQKPQYYGHQPSKRRRLY